MSGKKSIFLASVSGMVIMTCSSHALQTSPWLGNPFEWTSETGFTYSFYRKVQNASPQLSSFANNYDFWWDLGVTLSPRWDIQTEFEFAKTPFQSFNLRSAGLQGRFQCLNELEGDRFNLTLGFNFRAAPGHAMRDLSCPYSANCNYEVTLSIGKEWVDQGSWTNHLYGWISLGAGNHGQPWTRQLFMWKKNWNNVHRLFLFTAGDFGFGHKEKIDVKKFYGWGPFKHQSIDFGAGYEYEFLTMGKLSFNYAYRLFARSFPERVNFFTLTYTLPFSVL